jgi:glyoxylase-like metal-dependent hydrolase (beta-lactamase superfamily II)
MVSRIAQARQAWEQHGAQALGLPSAQASARLRVGGVDVVGLSDGEFRMTADFISDPAAHAALAGPDGRVSLPVGAFLIPGDEPVLIDAGVGPLHLDNLTGGNLLTALRGHGYAPEDIAVVALTHLHLDHSGWLGDAEGRPVFSRARHLIRTAEWDHFMGDGPGKVSFAHVEAALRTSFDDGRVELISGECAVSGHVTALPAPGHTPGHTVFAVHDGPDRALILGDAVHCPLQLTHPDWSALADVDPALARLTRKELGREMERAGVHGVGCHFPGLTASRIIGGELV